MKKNSLCTCGIVLIIYLFMISAYGQRASLIPFEDEKSGLWGYQDPQGRVLIEAIYLIALEFNSFGIAAVVDSSGWIFIREDGESILRPFVVDNGPDYFSEGLARYVDAGQIGFFDQGGRVIIAAQFEFVRSFSDSLAAFCSGGRVEKNGEYSRIVGGKWGFIDRSGNVRIKAEYDRVENFKAGKARVTKKEQSFYINKRGEIR